MHEDTASEGRTTSRPSPIETWIEDRVIEFSASDAQNGDTRDIADFVGRAKRSATESLGAEAAAAAADALTNRLRALGRAQIALMAGTAGTDTRKISTEFEIEAELGRGGMGRIFRARRRSDDEIVAIKVPLFTSALTERERVRLSREAEAIARLDHPGIVTLHGLIEHAGAPALVMEMVDGDSLAEVISDVRRSGASRLAQRLGQPELSHARAASTIVRQILEALDFAHAHGVVHRDLKPSNVMIDRTGRTRLLDFGLARLENDVSVTVTGDLVGTPQYVAPELLDDRHLVGHWTDVYGAGVLLYELLTCRHPFEARSVDAVLSRIRTGDARPPRSELCEISADLAAIVECAIAVRPQDRYASVRRMADDLARWERQEPVTARPVSQATRWLRRIRRRPEIALTVAVVVFLAASLAIFMTKTVHAQDRDHDLRVASALTQAETLVDANEWHRADDVLAGMSALLESELTDEDDRTRHAALCQQVEIVQRLDKLRGFGLTADWERIERSYAELFAELPLNSADAIRSHPIAPELVVGLDEWVRVLARLGDDAKPRLIEVSELVNAADEDTLRVRIRKALLRGDAKDLRTIAESSDVLALTAPALESLAESLERTGDRDTADRLFRLGPILHPDDFWMHRNLSEFLERTYHNDELQLATHAMRSALALRPDDARTLNLLSRLLGLLKEYDVSLHTAQRSLELDSTDPTTYLHIGTALVNLGKFEEGMAKIDRYIELEPVPHRRARGHWQAGILCQQTQHFAEGFERFEKAWKLSPDDPEILLGISAARITMGRLQEGMELLRHAHDIDPKNMIICGTLASTYELLTGEPRRALELYRHAEVREDLRHGKGLMFLPKAAGCALQVASLSPDRGGPETPEERLDLYREAIQWMSESIHAAVRMEATYPELEKIVLTELRDWDSNPLLAKIRDSRHLKELPEEMATKCRALWQWHAMVLGDR